MLWLHLYYPTCFVRSDIGGGGRRRRIVDIFNAGAYVIIMQKAVLDVVISHHMSITSPGHIAMLILVARLGSYSY
jgi:hypothetical protein